MDEKHKRKIMLSINFTKSAPFWQGGFLILTLMTPVSALAQKTVFTPDAAATRAAQEILDQGGSAADAAIAAQLALGLVRPDITGLGGGGFALYYDAEKGRLYEIEAQAAAPEQAGKYLFINRYGAPENREAVSIGGRAVGVPGVPALLEELYQRGGKLQRETLFQPALLLGENGYDIDPAFVRRVERNQQALQKYPRTRQMFLTAFGRPRSAGETVVNQDHAETLRLLREEGADGFYRGVVAREIVESVQTRAFDNRGLLAIEDLAEYQATGKPPLCGPYKGLTICTTSPPSSGLGVLLALKELDGLTLPRNNGSRVQIAAAIIAAHELRNAYIADPEMMPLPAEDFLRGETPEESFAADLSEFRSGGAVIMTADAQGNAAIVVSGAGGPFGAYLTAGGFVLNALLADFAFTPQKGGRTVLNAPGGGLKPRSPFAPVMAFDAQNHLRYLIAAPGGDAALALTVQAIVALVDWNMSPEQIKAMPKMAVANTVIVDEGLGTLPRMLEKEGMSVRTGEVEAKIAILRVN